MMEWGLGLCKLLYSSFDNYTSAEFYIEKNIMKIDLFFQLLCQEILYYFAIVGHQILSFTVVYWQFKQVQFRT